MYKLLALDMDGTLLNSQKKISPKTAEAILELSRRGIYVVVSTGRGVAELQDYKDELKFMNYGITSSGGAVYDFFNQKAIKAYTIPKEIAFEIINAGLAERAMIHILGLTKSVASETDIKNMPDFQMTIYQNMFDKICVRCDDFKKYVEENPDEIIKLNLYHRSPESRQKNFERLKHLNLTFALAETTALESSPKGISKASGLIELCNFLKIDIADTVAVGDAPNDIEVLKTAGIAAVMGNADDEIKKIADFVTDDNDHDGIIKVIEKYF
jgi:Cof subfamily protein (haloacid dehalogenase superfamily)